MKPSLLNGPAWPTERQLTMHEAAAWINQYHYPIALGTTRFLPVRCRVLNYKPYIDPPDLDEYMGLRIELSRYGAHTGQNKALYSGPPPARQVPELRAPAALVRRASRWRRCWRRCPPAASPGRWRGGGRPRRRAGRQCGRRRCRRRIPCRPVRRCEPRQPGLESPGLAGSRGGGGRRGLVGRSWRWKAPGGIELTSWLRFFRARRRQPGRPDPWSVDADEVSAVMCVPNLRTLLPGPGGSTGSLSLNTLDPGGPASPPGLGEACPCTLSIAVISEVRKGSPATEQLNEFRYFGRSRRWRRTCVLLSAGVLGDGSAQF